MRAVWAAKRTYMTYRTYRSRTTDHCPPDDPARFPLQSFSRQLILADVSLHLLTQLLDAAVEGIFAFDRNSRFTVWNKGMEDITGLRRTNVIGRNAFELFPSLIKTGEDSFFHGALTGERAICRRSSVSTVASA